MTRTRWPEVLDRARAIVGAYETGVTVRQLFYRLVAEQVLPNLQTYYRRLSERTAEARREGAFPDLLDRQSRIERYESFAGPDEARRVLRDLYRRDRTEGQDWTILLVVEKAGMRALEEGVTGKPGTNSGVGLTTVREFADRYGGVLRVRSGHGLVVHRRGRAEPQEVPGLPGTIVAVELASPGRRT